MKKKSNSIILIIFILFLTFSNAQVGIGTITPNDSAILDIVSSNRGVLLPRLDATQRAAIVSPSNGLIIYNTTTSAFNYYDNGWKVVLNDFISPAKGGTGIVNNDASTLTFPAAFPLSITTTASTAISLPVSGKLYGTEMASISSSEVLNSMIDKTGTGTIVFSASPALTGIATVPTATLETFSNQIASTQFVMNNSDKYSSINNTSTFTTVLTTDQLIPNTAISSPVGTYLVMYNSQYNTVGGGSSSSSTTLSNSQLVADLQTAYNTLKGLPVTNATHTPAYGNETLPPGVYALAGAISTAGTIILDGGGDSNAVFVFRTDGAFAAGANTIITLANGASACNVFWIAEGALSVGAASEFKGTCISHAGAISVGGGSTLIGRVFSFMGAATFGPGTITIPTACTYLNLGTLTTFAIFTGGGALSNAGTSTITGDLGTVSGAVTGLEAPTVHNGRVYANGTTTGGTTTTTASTPTVSFTIYKNGVIISDSNRTSNATNGIIALQSVVSVVATDVLDVRCKTESGTLNVTNKVLSLIHVR
jgi:Ice-binding-like